MPGIRGIGKSTLLAQIFALEKFLKPNKDKAILENIGIYDTKKGYDITASAKDSLKCMIIFE
jgi:ABC-type cobalamin/Fe3+-siderophores transport system ATPase subunit